MPIHRRWPVRTMFLSWFGLGLLGRAPGTLGSLGSIPLAAALVLSGGPWVLFAAAVAVFFLGWRLTALHLRDVTELKDPQWIVIDEVAAQWAVLAALPFSLPWYAAGFAAFRFFDIVKPWPVSWADRRVGGALGVMLDDVLAALYAVAILLAARALLGQGGAGIGS
jgi:phosphatidylglycerophosphatase A